MLSLGLFHINGDAANNDTFTISLQLQTYIAGKLPAQAIPICVGSYSTRSPPSGTLKSNQFVAHNFVGSCIICCQATSGYYFLFNFFFFAAFLGHYHLYDVSTHVFCPTKHALGYASNC